MKLGVTNLEIDLQNPDNLGCQSTDPENVVNLKWRMSDSKTMPLDGGWMCQQVITDLPASRDIVGAQQYIQNGGIRKLHWHRVVSRTPTLTSNQWPEYGQAEWGYLYKGSLGISAVDEEGRNRYKTIEEGDIWYFPKGMAHTIQDVGEHNEFLLTFDDGDFAATGTTFNVADWINHTPKDVLAKNFR
jgi:oxalate decarboxylase family bicupin protein